MEGKKIDGMTVNDGKGLYDNEGLCDSLIMDCNNLVKILLSGNYVQFCNAIVQMVKKLVNLKEGIKKDMDSKNSVIESLKETIRSMGENVVDMSVEEYLEKHDIKKAVNENATT